MPFLESRNAKQIERPAAGNEPGITACSPESNSSYYEMRLYTNIVGIGKSNYQRCIGGRFGKRFGDGALVMTTNHVYLWMVDRDAVKILDQDYEPHFFPPGF